MNLGKKLKKLIKLNKKGTAIKQTIINTENNIRELFKDEKGKDVTFEVKRVEEEKEVKKTITLQELWKEFNYCLAHLPNHPSIEDFKKHYPKQYHTIIEAKKDWGEFIQDQMKFGHEELGLTIMDGNIPPFELLELVEKRCEELENYIKKNGK